MFQNAFTREFYSDVPMRPSEVEWLGGIPAHWSISQVKRHYSIQLGKMLQNSASNQFDTEVFYLKAQHVQWFWVDTSDPPTMWASPSDIVQFGIRSGDLLVCEGGEGGRSGLVNSIASGYIIQNALHRVRPLVDSKNEFLLYLMSAIASTGWFDAITNKATIAHFTAEKFGTLVIPIPTIVEQVAIVSYLDYADQILRGGVSQKLELVELMEEYKRAVIQQAVTRGLDPDVPLKPSGVEWLGDIPVHWELLRLKTVMNERSEKGYPNEPLLSSTQKSGVILQENYENRTVLAMKDLHLLKLVLVGDFVISLRSFQGGIEFARDRGIISPAYTIIYPSNPRYHGYFAWLFKSKGFIENLKLHVTGIREGQNIDYERLSRSLIPIPPVEEQTAIVAHLDKLTSDIDTAIARTRHEIELLEEYRTRLIADVVTGKLDVREAAANLPDVNLDNIQPLAEGGEAGD